MKKIEICNSKVNEIVERLDKHVASSATKTKEVQGVTATYVCLCCYVLRLFAYGFGVGVCATLAMLAVYKMI